jgi:hypothetical protein
LLLPTLIINRFFLIDDGVPSPALFVRLRPLELVVGNDRPLLLEVGMCAIELASEPEVLFDSSASWRALSVGEVDIGSRRSEVVEEGLVVEDDVIIIDVVESEALVGMLGEIVMAGLLFEREFEESTCSITLLELPSRDSDLEEEREECEPCGNGMARG